MGIPEYLKFLGFFSVLSTVCTQDVYAYRTMFSSETGMWDLHTKST